MADLTGCGYDRAMTPSGALEGLGWRSLYGLRTSVAQLQGTDLLVGQRICTDDAMPLWRYLAGVRQGPATIYEVDDNLFQVELHNPGSFQFYSQEHIREKMAEAIMLADALMVTNEHLANELRRYNTNVIVIPNYLPRAHIYKRKATRGPSDVLIGWAGGSSHIEDLRSVREPLRAVIDDYSGTARFVNYGQDFRETLRLPHAEWIPWEQNKDAYLRKLDLDIGLCPLTDSLFNRCKTAIKALEYGARGIPAVASDVAP